MPTNNLPTPGSRVILHWLGGNRIIHGELLRRQVVNDMIRFFNDSLESEPPYYDEYADDFVEGEEPEYWPYYTGDDNDLFVLSDGWEPDRYVVNESLLEHIVRVAQMEWIHAENESCPSCRRA